MNTLHIIPAQEQPDAMRHFYRRHAALYNATRWAFLFGRKAILKYLPKLDHQLLVEAGCGTGYNLRNLAQLHRNWQLIGVDVSPEMLAHASRATSSFSRRVQLFEASYSGSDFQLPEQADIVLFSYSLTLFNPGWEAAIEQAWHDLKPGGLIAVVDFYKSPYGIFRWWMKRHHVRLDGHLLPALRARFQPVQQLVKPAALGMWQYFLFVGRK